jgi:hypothetical protein
MSRKDRVLVTAYLIFAAGAYPSGYSNNRFLAFPANIRLANPSGATYRTEDSTLKEGSSALPQILDLW